MKFNNDRLSHWFVGALLTWVMISLLFGFPIFHLWLKFSTGRVAAFMGLCFATQLAVTPWLFSARATAENPEGQVVQRSLAVAAWFAVIGVLFFHFIGQLSILSVVVVVVCTIATLVVVGASVRQGGKEARPPFKG